MSENKLKVQEPGVVNAQVPNIEVQSFDDNIRSSRRGKAMSPAVANVFEKMKNAIEFAQKNNGRSQIMFPHNDFPLCKDKLPNTNIANALLKCKKRFSNIQFSIAIDAVNSDGVKLNASVLKLIIKPTEEKVEEKVN